MRYHKLSLIGILLIAGLLRFYGLAGRGLFFADETRYYRDAARIKAGISAYLKKSGPEKTIKALFGALSVIDKGSFAGKPGQSSLGLIGLFVFGDYQHSVLFVSALLGIGTVALVFLIGYRLYSAKVGLISALILSVCPAHILFSRSFLAHSNQAFFLMLAVYLYMERKTALYILSALCAGYAFLIHPTGLIYFMPFLVYEVFLWLKRKRRLRDISIFCLAFLAPFFIVEAISILCKEEFGSLAVALKNSYADQLLFMNSDAAQLGLATNKNLGPWHYLIMSGLSNGACFTILLVLSVVFCLGAAFKKRGPQNFILIIAPFLLYLYWQYLAVHERLLREVLFLFPFFCVMMAIFICRLNRRAAAILVGILLLEGAWYSSKIILQVKSDYPRIERFLRDNKITKIITPSGYLATTSDVLMPNLKDLQFYLVSSFSEAKGVSEREGINYLLMWPGNWLEDEAYRFTTPALATAREPSYGYFPTFYETARGGGRTEYLKYKNRPEAMSVAVYGIDDKKIL